jgi:hypothetical protein
LAEKHPNYFNLLLMDPPWHVTKVARRPKLLFEWDKVTLTIVTFPHYYTKYHLPLDPHVIIQIVIIILVIADLESW